MNSVDLLVLEEVGITELMAHSQHWDEPAPEGRRGGVRTPDALARLEQLGLVVRTARSLRGGVSLTSAGVEALAYLATAA